MKQCWRRTFALFICCSFQLALHCTSLGHQPNPNNNRGNNRSACSHHGDSLHHAACLLTCAFESRTRTERGLRNRRQERPLWHAQSAVTRSLGIPSHHYEEALKFVQSDECNVAAVHEHLRVCHGRLWELNVCLPPFLPVVAYCCPLLPSAAHCYRSTDCCPLLLAPVPCCPVCRR